MTNLSTFGSYISWTSIFPCFFFAEFMNLMGGVPWSPRLKKGFLKKRKGGAGQTRLGGVAVLIAIYIYTALFELPKHWRLDAGWCNLSFLREMHLTRACLFWCSRTKDKWHKFVAQTNSTTLVPVPPQFGYQNEAQTLYSHFFFFCDVTLAVTNLEPLNRKKRILLIIPIWRSMQSPNDWHATIGLWDQVPQMNTEAATYAQAPRVVQTISSFYCIQIYKQGQQDTHFFDIGNG